MTEAAVTIKKCTSKDLSELLGLARDTFVETFGHLNDPLHFDAYVEKAFAEEQMRKELENPDSHFYFAYYRHQLAGYLKLNLAPAQSDINDPESLEVERIYVVGPYHGKGLGKTLFQRALDMAHEKRLSYIWLGVWEHNTKALRFYESYGFYRFAQHPFKLGDDLQTDWLMRLDL